MNLIKFNRRTNGFTLVEMLVVIGIIAVLAAFLLPALGRGKASARRAECASDLREIGLASHLFANDHNGRYPTQISTNDGGAAEFVAAGYQIQGTFFFSYKFVLPLATTLGTPKLFACPADSGRWAGASFGRFANTNLSYVVGLVTDPNDPRVILAADRGLPVAYTEDYTIRHLPVVNTPRWSGGHGQNGEILFADGHVDHSNNSTVRSEEAVAEDVAYPSVKEAPMMVGTGNGGSGGSGAGGGGAGGSGNSGPVSSVASGQPNSPASANKDASATNSDSLSQPAGGAEAANPALHPSSASPAGNTRASHANSRSYVRATAGGQSPLDLTNPVTETAPASTNGAGGTSLPGGGEQNMSPFDKDLAHLLRQIIFGTYFLILLLMLIFAAYRLWRLIREQQDKRQP